MFIVFEGLDASGKSSHSQILSDWLASAGFSTLWACEPTYYSTGASVRRGIKEMNKTAMGLARDFVSDRCAHQTKLRHFLATNKLPIIICDRYIASSLAYQWDELDDDKGFAAIWDMNKTFMLPDLIVFMQVSKEVAGQRLAKRAGKIELEAETRFDETERRYKKAFDLMSSLPHHPVQVSVVNADNDYDDVQYSIRNVVSRFLAEKKLL